jgi:hypothetical protein
VTVSGHRGQARHHVWAGCVRKSAFCKAAGRAAVRAGVLYGGRAPLCQRQSMAAMGGDVEGALHGGVDVVLPAFSAQKGPFLCAQGAV